MLALMWKWLGKPRDCRFGMDRPRGNLARLAAWARPNVRRSSGLDLSPRRTGPPCRRHGGPDVPATPWPARCFASKLQCRVWLTPAQAQQAYGFDQITFPERAVRGDGTGQTIAIIDA